MINTVPTFDPLDPYPWFGWMRQNAPVYQDPLSHIWYVFGYQDVMQVLNPPIKPTADDPIVFSSAMPTVGEHRTAQESIIFTDPPRQRSVRELLNPAFSPQTLRDHYAARIVVIIDQLLDQVIDTGEMDVVAHLAYEIPLLVISELLDVPAEDRPTLLYWANIASGRVDLDAEAATILNRVPELGQYFLHTIAQRREHPPEGPSDLISTLVHGCPRDGVPLSEAELLGNCELLLAAGFETTAHLLSNLFRVLDAFPQVQQQVWQNPSLVPALIEETLRYHAPVHVQVRLTTTEVTLRGKTIPANQLVMPLLSSANRDEQVFAHADSFDLSRFATAAPNHLAFGFRGTHFCLGAPLARLEATLLMQRLIERMEQIHVKPGVSLKAITTEGLFVPGLNGVQALPVTFTRR